MARWSGVGPTLARVPAARVLLLGILAAAVMAQLVAATSSLFRGAQAGREAAASPPLKVAVEAMWLGSEPVMRELWVLSTISERVLGRRMIPEERQDAADVILFGPYGDRQRSGDVARNYSGKAIRIFIGSENQAFAGYDDQMAGAVDISLGHRMDITMPSYLRLPWWLPYTLTREHGCAFPPQLHEPSDPAAWKARPGFATLLSRHYAYPRPQLFELLNSSGYGRVDAPSAAFHNMEWPAQLPNSHLNGKVDFLGSYRFNICPENSRTPDGGYNTEKLPQAHLAGAVPIYWGDAPIDPQVFNPRRVIYFDGTNSSVMGTINRLEQDADFRREWFARPLLSVGAESWLSQWCTNLGDLFVKEHARLLMTRAGGPNR